MNVSKYRFLKENLKNKVHFLKIFNENINFIYLHLSSLLNNLNNILSLHIIDQDYYHDIMIEIEIIFENMEKYARPLKFDVFKSKNELQLNDHILYLHNQINSLIKKIAATNNTQTINIYFKNNNWNKKDTISELYIRAIHFYDFFFIPIKCNIIDSPEEIKNFKKYLKVPLLPFVTHINKKNPTLNEKINGASIHYPFSDKLIIVIDGIFKKDQINMYKYGGTFESKYKSLINDIDYLDVPFDFKNKYINQLSLRDFIVNEEKEIYDMIKKDYEESSKLKSKTTSLLIKDFIKSNQETQIKTLILLLISDNDSQVNAKIIFDLLNNNTFIGNNDIYTEQIYNNLPWSVQKILKRVIKSEDQKKKKINIEQNDIPYETRINLLKVSDNIKRKAFEKLKEVKGSKENSVKATQWLDGFLKIPFNVYREEDILKFFKNFKIKMENLINIYTIKISDLSELKMNTHDKEFFEKITNIIDDYYANVSNFSEKSFNQYMILIEGMIKAIDNEKLIKNEQFKKFILFIYEEMKNILDDWGKYQINKKKYIENVNKVLNTSVHGQLEAKNQLKRIIGQWINGETNSTCFGLCGPPGVGKTTLCKNGLSKCLVDDQGNARPFAFLPLGGASNGSFLEGHNYTYMGSTWGRIVDILIEAKCMNPIIYIDELDKVSKSEHGHEIISILTHVTDASQNKEYFDKYFNGIPIDLSKVLFVFSYNDPSLIDRILLDRIQTININPLDMNDKLIIARNYVLPDICKNVGFKDDEIKISKSTINNIIKKYTYEAGVRKLNEILFDIIREINLRKIMGENYEYPIDINQELIENILEDKPIFEEKRIFSSPHVGIINGLYASGGSGHGGITIIQCLRTSSDRKFVVEKVTGNLGEILKESISCAMTLAWNLLPKEYKDKINNSTDSFAALHIHYSEASTHKEGPSSGIGLLLVILSRICEIEIRNDIAVTGEIDICANVLPIGGLTAKLLGAITAGVKKALIPIGNKKDYDKFVKNYPEEYGKIEVVLIDNIYQSFDHIFVNNKNIVFEKIL